MIDENFCNWFAGLTDGEGSFQLYKNTDNRNGVSRYRAMFKLGLRSDDGETLFYIHEQLQFGRLRQIGEKQTGDYTSKSGILFELDSNKDCLKLVGVFKNRLHSKKAVEFLLWSEAVILIDKYGSGQTSIALDRIAAISIDLSGLKRFNINKSESNLDALELAQ